MSNPNGNRSGSEILRDVFGRTPQFMQYTSRAPYHGQYNAQKNNDRLSPIFETWRDLSQSTPGSDEHELLLAYRIKAEFQRKTFKASQIRITGLAMVTPNYSQDTS